MACTSSTCLLASKQCILKSRNQLVEQLFNAAESALRLLPNIGLCRHCVLHRSLLVYASIRGICGDFEVGTASSHSRFRRYKSHTEARCQGSMSCTIPSTLSGYQKRDSLDAEFVDKIRRASTRKATICSINTQYSLMVDQGRAYLYAPHLAHDSLHRASLIVVIAIFCTRVNGSGHAKLQHHK